MTHLRREIIPGIGEAVVARPQISDAHKELLFRTAFQPYQDGSDPVDGELLAEVLPQTVSEPHPTTGEDVTIFPLNGLPRRTRYVIADAVNYHVSPSIIIDSSFAE